jgi:hypothetical protein
MKTNNTGLDDNSVHILNTGTNPLKVDYDLVNTIAGTINT